MGKFFIRNMLHPLVMASVLWFIIAGVVSYEPFFNIDLQSVWSLDMHLVVIVGGVSIFIPTIVFPIRVGYRVERFLIPNHFKVCVNTMAILSVIVFFIRFKNSIFHPAILNAGDGDLKELVPPGIAGLHYIDLFTPIIGLCLFFEILYSSKVSKSRLVFALLFNLFVLISIVMYKISRDELTQYLVGFLFIWIVARPAHRLRIALLGLSVLWLIFIITSARLDENSAVFNHFSGGLGVFFSIFYTYTAYNFENVNKLVSADVQPTYIWGSLKFILRFFYSDEYDKNAFNIVMKDSAFFNAKTYLYMFYHDMRLYGVFLYSFLLGTCTQFVYYLAVNNSRFILLLATFLKPLLFMFFGNFFFVELTYFFVYPLTFCFAVLLYRKIYILKFTK
ncbi:MAG: O-antigen polymerase [Pseudoalteromonas nigrifaciens]|uniref:O-antigen polymerase n=1 Tax=Pseudoalteromonas nigrifaciens TaxID=28109 RepID=UPI003F9791B4